MAIVKIRKSVGHKGKNEPEDTKKVQQLLNAHAKASGFKKLAVDGIVGPKTIGAIKGFQKDAMGGKVDGRVDANNKTIAALNRKPGSVGSGGGSGGGGNSGGGVDPKVEQEAGKVVEKLARDLSALPRKEKADLDKTEKLMKSLEKEAKGDKTAGKNQHATARAEVLKYWEAMKRHRKDAMGKVAKIAEVCKKPAPSGATWDKYEELQLHGGLTIEPMADWARQINYMEKAAKGLDPKSPLAKGVRDTIKLQRRLWDEVLKGSNKDFNDTLQRLNKMKQKQC